MGDLLRRFAGPVIAFSFWAGLQVSGIQELWIAVVLWTIGGLWAIAAVITWPPVRQHLPIPEYEIRVRRIQHARSRAQELEVVRPAETKPTDRQLEIQIMSRTGSYRSGDEW